MIEAAMIWNEPNNKSHWDLEADPGWARFAEMARLAGEAIAAESPGLTRVLGGISPIDANFMRLMQSSGVTDAVDAVAVHGFPLDWNLWPLHDWPQRLDDIRVVLPDEGGSSVLDGSIVAPCRNRRPRCCDRYRTRRNGSQAFRSTDALHGAP